MTNENIFGLDIGTRTVIGLVGKKEGDKFCLIAQEMVEHAGRAMYDGQIHDVPQVAEAVKKVKAGLEKKVGYRLDEVAIAAAGRSLKTVRCFAEQKVNEYVEINEQIVHGLELIAVHKAQEELTQGLNAQERFYYVGHSVVSFYLDNFPIKNLIGHRAKVTGVEVLATFLPASVVDSLFSVLSRASLQPVNLTLEPIAAADAAIPQAFRLLNLALVDIGAGTSDIAITRDGAIVAYGMVPSAGDEISEAIVESCLVDFVTAEQIKRQMGEAGEIAYTDILGNSNSITSEKLTEILSPVLDRLAGEIAGSILDLNGNEPPKSVFCIGGGVQVPTLTDRIAGCLNIGYQRVGIRNRNMLQSLSCPADDEFKGPEGITVIGIATLALKKAGYTFINIKVNGRECRIFNLSGLTVSHCLNYIDFNPRLLIARPGKDLQFILNGRREVVLGELPKQAAIFLNGKQANLQTQVNNGDEIIFEAAQTGKDATAFIRDYMSPELIVNFTLDGKQISLNPLCTLNDLNVGTEAEIKSNDRLTMDCNYTLEKVAGMPGISIDIAEIYVNGTRVDKDYLVREGDRLETKPFVEINNKAPEGQHMEHTPSGLKVKVNGKPVVLQGVQRPIFVDALNFINFNLSERIKNLDLKLNGEKARYTDPLKDGDEIVIKWESDPWPGQN